MPCICMAGIFVVAIVKCVWWMPRDQEAMKDVAACDKPRGAGKQALIRGFPNGETCRDEVATALLL